MAAGKKRPRRPPLTRTLVRTDINVDRTGLQIGTLRVPYSHNRSAYGHLRTDMGFEAPTGPVTWNISGPLFMLETIS